MCLEDPWGSECYNPRMPWYLRLLQGVEITIYVIFFTGLLGGSSMIMSTNSSETARTYTRAVEFDYVSWTLEALAVKLDQSSLGTPYYFSQRSRHQIVVDYLHLMDAILSDESKITNLYSNPKVSDPGAAALPLQQQLDGLDRQEIQLAPLAESVLQEQVSATLSDVGLTTGGQPLPPVLFHISPLPYDLIISPRDKIQEDAAISLIPTLSVDQQNTLENQVDSGLSVSSLVVPVGGIGSYPTMIERTTALDWLSDTIAHEWTHNWLALRPLGLNYDTTPELRTMNETTASITGGEISVLVIKKYYPELALEYNIQNASLPLSTPQVTFDFNSEMHITRVQVDALLTQGKVNEAESYMEQRRQFFWDNGYAIRKLNQAYFAFYGAYANVPGGAAGEDPVGPAVRALRAQSATLADFLNKISQMSSFQQLQAAVSPGG
jgi:hypothetical protein